jgi:hypothetical protein
MAAPRAPPRFVKKLGRGGGGPDPSQGARWRSRSSWHGSAPMHRVAERDEAFARAGVGNVPRIDAQNAPASPRGAVAFAEPLLITLEVEEPRPGGAPLPSPRPRGSTRPAPRCDRSRRRGAPTASASVFRVAGPVTINTSRTACDLAGRLAVLIGAGLDASAGWRWASSSLLRTMVGPASLRQRPHEGGWVRWNASSRPAVR